MIICLAYFDIHCLKAIKIISRIQKWVKSGSPPEASNGQAAGSCPSCFTPTKLPDTRKPMEDGSLHRRPR